MKDEIKAGVAYATDNLDSAKILLEQHFVLPDFEPGITLCRQCIALAEKVAEKALRMVG